MTTITIDTSLSLELIDDHHAEDVFQLIDTNRQHLEPWFPWVPNMQTAAHLRNFISGSKLRYLDKTEEAYVIMLEGKAVGRIGLYYFDLNNKIASIGYWLDEQQQGKGIATKACRALISHGFSTLGLNRIELKCGTNNDKSIAIAEKLIFTQEGILKQAEAHHETFIDLYLFSMLKQNWKE
jgi:ribosomal-protein-serine acetyltransferase